MKVKRRSRIFNLDGNLKRIRLKRADDASRNETQIRANRSNSVITN